MVGLHYMLYTYAINENIKPPETYFAVPMRAGAMLFAFIEIHDKSKLKTWNERGPGFFFSLKIDILSRNLIVEASDVWWIKKWKATSYALALS